MTWTWVEPFAGAAACALRLVGGRDLLPPVAWMGGKRRLARAILDAMGVPSGPPSRVLLADAGPWGWVWPLLLRPEDAAKVAAVLRSWAGEHPRELWQRLAAQPPADAPHERAAQWLWLQARSASGVPIWWDGWRLEAGNGRPTDRGEDLRWPGHRAERERWDTGRTVRAGQTGRKGGGWRASNGQGDAVAAGHKGLGARWEKGTPAGREPQDAMNGQRGYGPGSWRFDARPGDLKPDRLAGPSGETNGRTGGMVNPCTIATRVEALATAFGGRWLASDGRGDPRPAGMKPDERTDGVRRANGIMDPSVVAGRVEALAGAGRGVAWSVHHGDARVLGPPAARSDGGGAWVYLDPPYVGATGYGWDLERGLVLELARRWADAGAVVAVSEAEPLDLPGWHAVDLTRPGGKPEWLTLSRPPAVLPQRQGDLFGSVA